MKPSTPLPAPELHAAVAAEAEAAGRLSEALERLRRGTETRDAAGLDPVLEQAQRAADGMTRAGAERLRRTLALARALELGGEPTLARVAARVGDGLEAAAARLLERLQGVARESAALGICTRFGAVSSQRLQALQRAAFGLHAGYGADGRLGGSLQGQGRRA
ncbi:MAG: hypothetical protein P1P84_15440 [Deferrisomatales bacterium]|nr:hypothetical protein [Deferrisomatales bacterium]